MTAVSRFKSNTCRAALTLTLGFLLASPWAHGQEFRGTISGSVTDPTGAALPGADIQIKEIHTGALSRTKSDAAGQYVVPFLLPGDYQITVTEPGFQTEIRSNITLQSQEHPIVDLKTRGR